MRSPKKSFTCVLAMITAIPLVKPTTTGRGMNFTAEPKPVAPSTTSMMPASSVQMYSPIIPCFSTIPDTITTNAPVGPPICVFEPPSAEIRNPATTAQYNAGLWRHTGGNRKRHRQRQRNQAHGNAGNQIGKKLLTVVVSEAKN